MVRVKRRYIVFKIECDGHRVNQAQESFTRELRERVAELYGDFGVASLNRGFSVKRFDPKEGYLILAVRRGVHEMVMSVAPWIVSIDKMRSSVRIIHLSGTVRGCLKHLKKVYIMSVREAIAAKSSEMNVQSKMECDVSS